MDRAQFLFYLQICLPVIALLSLLVASPLWLCVSVCMFFLMRSVGYVMTYHRVLSHSTHRMHPVVEFLCIGLGFYGSMSSPLDSASTHSNHHRYMDTDRDPHSPKYLGWRAWFPLYWVDKDKGHFKTIVRLSRNPRVMFFHKNYWRLIFLPLLLLLVSLNAFLFLWLVPAALSLVTLSWSVYNHDNDGPKDMSWLFGLLTGGEHKHTWHHNHANDTSGEGLLGWIMDRIFTKNTGGY